MAKTSAILYSPDGVAPPDVVQRWLDALGVPIVTVNDADTLMGASLRTRPRVVVFDSRRKPSDVLEALRRVKSDSYTGVVPAVVITTDDPASFDAGFRAGGDEVIRDPADPAEATIRLDAMLRRSDRDLYVHPSTRLPGAVEIEAEIGRRLVAQQRSSPRATPISITSRNSTTDTRTTRAIGSSGFSPRFCTTW